MSAFEEHQVYSKWRTALARLNEVKERLDEASDAEKAELQMEYDDALAAYLAIAAEL